MTLSDKLTRDQVRDAFNRNLTYADLCGIDIRALQGFIAIECARHDRKLASKGELLMLMQPSCLKKHAPNISASTERPGIYEAFLRVDGRYWQGREAVSFNGDGFIGIAGWADDNNVQPFLRGFMRWLVRGYLMGLFKRVECNEEAEQPSMSAAELEQMVYATYQEKLDLAKQLDGAKARIESLEETLQEKTTKLRAAEEFARQSESERKSTASKIEPLEQSKKQLQTNLKQEKARAATLEVRIEELENASRGRMAAYRRELVEEMQRQAVCASGGWSKARVLGFLGGFLPETEEVTSYDGSFVAECDSEPEPRRSAKKA